MTKPHARSVIRNLVRVGIMLAGLALLISGAANLLHHSAPAPSVPALSETGTWMNPNASRANAALLEITDGNGTLTLCPVTGSGFYTVRIRGLSSGAGHIFTLTPQRTRLYLKSGGSKPPANAGTAMLMHTADGLSERLLPAPGSGAGEELILVCSS